METRKTVKVKFIPFWPGFDEKDNFLMNILKKRYSVILSDEPDYLFCPISSEEQLYHPECIKILFSGENLTPDFNMYDYGIAFDHISFEDRYMRFPYAYLDKGKFELAEKKHTSLCNPNEKRFCNFIYSNGAADPIREKFFDLLCTYKKVESLGKYRNNVGGTTCKDKLECQKQYKFSIAFENSSRSGYVTEKIVDAFAAGTIPIYWGDPGIEQQFNPKSFVNAMKYDSLEKLVEVIKEIDQDDDLYMSMIQEPAIIQEKYRAEKMWSELEAFLFHIFDQPKEQAYRHNRVFWGEIYMNKQIAYAKAYHEWIGIKSKIKKCIPFIGK